MAHRWKRLRHSFASTFLGWGSIRLCLLNISDLDCHVVVSFLSTLLTVGHTMIVHLHEVQLLRVTCELLRHRHVGVTGVREFSICKYRISSVPGIRFRIRRLLYFPFCLFMLKGRFQSSLGIMFSSIYAYIYAYALYTRRAFAFRHSFCSLPVMHMLPANSFAVNLLLPCSSQELSFPPRQALPCWNFTVINKR